LRCRSRSAGAARRLRDVRANVEKPEGRIWPRGWRGSRSISARARLPAGATLIPRLLERTAAIPGVEASVAFGEHSRTRASPTGR
jgi:hypothetical protein